MNPKETAFIFIEFQNDFCTEGGKLYELVRDEIARNKTVPNAVRLLSAARKRGGLIIHCPFVMDAAWIDTHTCEGILSGIRAGEIFAPDSWGQAIIDAMAPQDGEIVLQNKRTLSAFSHTNLRAVLDQAGIKNLIVSGFLTNICAQATAYSAYDLGYTTRMAMDACGAATEAIQQYAEANLPPLLGGASTVDGILAELA